MGIIAAGFLLIGMVVLVLFGEALNKVAEESTEQRTAPSVPKERDTAMTSQAGKTRPEVPDHR